MPLPVLDPLPTRTITVGGSEVTIRSLSRIEAARLPQFGREEGEAEAFLIACAFDVTEDEAKAWLQAVDPLAGDEVLEEILDLSAIRELVRRNEAREAEAEDPKA